MARPDCIDHGRRSKVGYAHANDSATRARWGKPMQLHRLAFHDRHGYLPEVVRHSCDNPRCVNPDHLEGGTQLDNIADRVARGRSAKAVPSRRRLAPAQVDLIRWRLAQGHPIPAIAKDNGVFYQSIMDIRDGKTYRT